MSDASRDSRAVRWRVVRGAGRLVRDNKISVRTTEEAKGDASEVRDGSDHRI